MDGKIGLLAGYWAKYLCGKYYLVVIALTTIPKEAQ